MEIQEPGYIQLQIKAGVAALLQDVLCALQQQQSAFDATMKAVQEQAALFQQHQAACLAAAMTELKELKELVQAMVQAPGGAPALAGGPGPNTTKQALGTSHQAGSPQDLLAASTQVHASCMRAVPVGIASTAQQGPVSMQTPV